MNTLQDPQVNKDDQPRSRRYLGYLIVVMGLVAVMDQYLSTVKTTAIPYIIEEYGVSASRFSWLEALYLISSFSSEVSRIFAAWSKYVLAFCLICSPVSIGRVVFWPDGSPMRRVKSPTTRTPM